VSKSRIKRLRGIDSPQYRLRVGEFRVFYDVTRQEVYVLRVLTKAAVAAYLREVDDEAENGEREAIGPGNGDGGD
jgi:mRNA-degrading endonuclease RelE of RelBE toxin-antitoxin system